jgi:ATP-dependent protease ClpP protease subunit
MRAIYILGLLAILSGVMAHGPSSPVVNERKTINLTPDNFVVIRNEIDGISASRFVHEISNLRNKEEVVVFLDTPGGSVRSGMEIANYIKTLSTKGVRVTCVANNAMSMGFVIMQYCPTRYIMESSIMMQHQMSLGFRGPMRNVDEYMKLIHHMSDDLDTVQSYRIGMDLDSFRETVVHDWWLSGEQIVHANVADEVVNVVCDFNPAKITETVFTIFGPVKVTYSSCPLATAPIEIAFGDVKAENYNNVVDMLIPMRAVQHIKYMDLDY